MDWLESLILGVVQGLTEFLPVSSDGHLSLVQNAFDSLRGHETTAAEKFFFDVMLHLGTLAAIVLFYRAAALQGARGLMGATDVPPPYQQRRTIRVGFLVCVGTLPLIPLALFLKDKIEATFQGITAAGIGFLVTAVVLMLTARLRGGHKGPSETTFLDALLIGIAQAFAPLPGVSRSGLTIASALALGLSRSWAVEFSFLLAVPAILGATVLELRKLHIGGLPGDRIAQIVVAATISGVVGYAAIKWLVLIVRRGRLWYFSVYLIALGVTVLGVAAWGRRETDAGRSKAAVDRPLPRSLGDARGGPGRGASGTVEPVDRAVTGRARAAPARVDDRLRAGLRFTGLDLGGPVDRRGDAVAAAAGKAGTRRSPRSGL